MKTDQSKNFCKNCYVQKIHNMHSDYCVGCLVINKELGKYVCYEFIANSIAGSCMGCWKLYNNNHGWKNYGITDANHGWKNYNIKDANFVVCESCEDRLWWFSTKYKKLNEGSPINKTKQMADFKPKRETASSRIIEQLDQVMCTVQDVANEMEIVKKQTRDDMQPRTQMIETNMLTINYNMIEILENQKRMQDRIDQIQATQTYGFQNMTECNADQVLKGIERIAEFRNKYDDIVSRTEAIEQKIKASCQKTIFHIENRAADTRADMDELKDMVNELDMPALVEANPDSWESSDEDMPSLVDSDYDNDYWNKSEDTPEPDYLKKMELVDAHGNLIIYTINKDGLTHGEYVVYDPAGFIINQTQYVDGEKHGEHYERLVGEKDLVTRGYYVAGKKSGTWKYLEGVETGQRFLSEQTFENDKLHGPSKGNFNNNFYNEKFEGRYANDLKTGKWTFWRQ